MPEGFHKFKDVIYRVGNKSSLAVLRHIKKTLCDCDWAF